jgi:ABC-type glycerol-3-phosphate transport system substrate-binding protein
MKASVLILAVAAMMFLAGCGNKSSTTPAQGTNTASAGTNAEPNYNTGNPVTAVPDYLGAVAQAERHAEKVIDVSYINQDIQLFHASEGRYPKDLQELIPDYLAKIPPVPYGYKLDYDTNTYTVKVVKK